MSERKKDILFVCCILMIWSFSILSFIKGNTPDNDIYFLASTGRYIMEHGFAYYNPFCIDDGMKIIVQNWFVCVADYVIYDNFGNFGLLVLASLYMMLNSIAVLIFISCFTKSRQVKLFMLFLTTLSFQMFYNIRGSIVTAGILLLYVTCLLWYRREHKYRYLLPLPVFSVFLSNWQSSLWFMFLVFMLPFLVPDNTKDYLGGLKSFLAYYKRRWRYNLSLCLVAVIMFVAGLCNPYGMDAIRYPFLSAGSLSSFVNEIQMPVTLARDSIPLIVAFAGLCVYVMRRKSFADPQLVILCMGAMLLSCTMKRNVWYVVFAMPPLLEMLSELVKYEKWKKIPALLLPPGKVAYGFCIFYMMLFVSAMIFFAVHKPYSAAVGETDTIYTPVSAVEYLKREKSSENVKILSSFNNGGFFEWHGYKVYIDSRPEIYNARINGKKDVYEEYKEIYAGIADYDRIIGEYAFTHVYTDFGSPLYYYLQENDSWHGLYTLSEVKKKGYQFYEMR